MRILRLLSLYLFFNFSLSTYVYADLKIKTFKKDMRLSWDESIEVWELGLKAENIAQNAYYPDFSFHLGRDHGYYYIKRLNKSSNITYKNGEVSFQFKEKLFDGQEIVLKFLMKRKNRQKNTNDFFREAYAFLPKFAAMNYGELKVAVDDDLAINDISLDFDKIDDRHYFWKGIIPKEGVRSTLMYTKNRAKIRLVRKRNLNFPFSNKKLLINRGDNQPFDRPYEILNNQLKPLKHRAVRYNVDSVGSLSYWEVSPGPVRFATVMDLDIEADPRAYQLNWDLDKYSEISQKELALVHKIAKNIRTKAKEKGVSDHQYAVNWIHDHIKYDYSELGKNLNLNFVVSKYRGVCEHFAILYTYVMRALGSPTVLAYGYAFDKETGKMVAHAWNYIHVDGEWLGVDPTWNLATGSLPVSHILTSMTGKPEYTYTFWSSKKTSENQSKFDTSSEAYAVLLAD